MIKMKERKKRPDSQRVRKDTCQYSYSSDSHSLWASSSSFSFPAAPSSSSTALLYRLWLRSHPFSVISTYWDFVTAKQALVTAEKRIRLTKLKNIQYLTWQHGKYIKVVTQQVTTYGYIILYHTLLFSYLLLLWPRYHSFVGLFLAASHKS